MKRPSRSRFLPHLVVLVCVCGVFPLPAHAAPVRVAYELMRDGKIDSAEREFNANLEDAEKRNDTQDAWLALLNLSWFYDETGRSERAIEFAQRALALALPGAEKGKEFSERVASLPAYQRWQVGKSLDWLAWGYSRLGNYELARYFYREALKAVDGLNDLSSQRVRGLAKQELGSLMFEMGEGDAGKKLIREALELAENLKVESGQAECELRLAEIALQEGEVKVAYDYARSAEGHAVSADESVYNIAWARQLLAESKALESYRDPRQTAEASELAKKSVAFAESRGIQIMLARALLTQARVLPTSQSEQKQQLILRAKGILDELGSELRGLAQSELGNTALERNDLVAAEFFLKNGFDINQELRRNTANAFVSDSRALVAKLNEETQKEIAHRQDALVRADAAHNPALASVESERLAEIFNEQQWFKIAYNEADRGLQLAARAQAQNKDPLIQASLYKRQEHLVEILANAAKHLGIGIRRDL